VSLLAACEFLTVLPFGTRTETPAREVERSITWFPMVGALLGLMLVAVDWGSRLVVATPVTNALLLATIVVCTGSLHLDGLIDSANGLVAGPDRVARLAVMHHSVASSPGAIAGAWVMCATYVALGAVPVAIHPAVLLLMPACGRTGILVAYRLFPYARQELSLSAALKRGATTSRALVGVGAAGALCLLVGGAGGLAMLGVALLTMLAVSGLAMARLGGITGDVCGATCVLSELAVVLVAPYMLVQ
jgi:adenosylcobinamide-GDP ribazoletransferase